MSRSRVHRFTDPSRKSGNVVLLAVLLLAFLAALAAAQFTVVHRNAQSSAYFLARSDLHKYAESGIELALHDLTYKLSGKDGDIGTENWTVVNDVGRDGLPGTSDEGEGDGIPTPGEQQVNLVPVGSSANLSAGLMVWVSDTAFANIKRVVATAASANPNAMATVDTFVRRTVPQIPHVGAVYVDPDVALDLKGNAFRIDGNDHDLTGNKLPTGGLDGISTDVGDPPGSNEVNLLAQIGSKNYDQVVGVGGMPSIGETPDVSLDALFDSFGALKTKELAPGTYSNVTLGNLSKLEVTYVKGDLQLSGKGQGAGVLFIDGSVTFTGQFTFYGLVLVRGDVRMAGGGSGFHCLGSVMVGESITAIDPLSAEDMTISGNADIFYCSEMLNRLNGLLKDDYAIVYYDDK